MGFLNIRKLKYKPQYDKKMYYSIIISDFSRDNSIYGFKSWIFQDYKEYEIIVITCNKRIPYEDIKDEFIDKNIKIIRIPQPDIFNLSAFRNLGVFYSTGNKLIFPGSDVLFSSDTLDKLSKLYLGASELIGHTGIHQELIDLPTITSCSENLNRYIKKINKIVNTNVYSYGGLKYYDRDIFIEQGGFNDMVLAHEDTEIDIRFKNIVHDHANNIFLLNREIRGIHIISDVSDEYNTKHIANVDKEIEKKCLSLVSNKIEINNIKKLPKLNMDESYLYKRIYNTKF